MFVSNIRFWSMVSIIAVHCLYACGAANSSSSSELEIIFVQLVKFGTIGFFIISGFLLGTRIESGSRFQYFLRRLKNVALPWLVWASVCYIATLSRGMASGANADFHAVSSSLYVHAKDVVFHSPYWFVPNFLLCLVILLLCRPVLHSVPFGLTLLSFSLFYGVNSYTHWISSSHTAALFGFAFYQWLGFQIARHRPTVTRLLIKFEWKFAIALILATAAVALAESVLMMRRFSLSPIESLNSLRLSNQVFSLAVILALLKITNPAWPSFVNVRAHTYGLFLIHPICILALTALARRIVQLPVSYTAGSATMHFSGPIGRLVASLVLFVLTYALSLAVTIGLSRRSTLGWLVSSNQYSLSVVLQTSPALHANTRPVSDDGTGEIEAIVRE